MNSVIKSLLKYPEKEYISNNLRKALDYLTCFIFRFFKLKKVNHAMAQYTQCVSANVSNNTIKNQR